MEIGKKLFISEGTVKIHLHNIYRKLGADSRIKSSLATPRKRDSYRRAGAGWHGGVSILQRPISIRPNISSVERSRRRVLSPPGGRELE
jgi:hypothetical protein